MLFCMSRCLFSAALGQIRTKAKYRSAELSRPWVMIMGCNWKVEGTSLLCTVKLPLTEKKPPELLQWEFTASPVMYFMEPMLFLSFPVGLQGAINTVVVTLTNSVWTLTHPKQGHHKWKVNNLVITWKVHHMGLLKTFCFCVNLVSYSIK